MVTDARPAKVTRWLVPAATAAPPADRPRSTWRKVTGWVPNTLDSRIRADRPAALVQTTLRMVWLLNPAEEKSVAEVRLGGVAGDGLAAQVDTQWPAPEWFAVAALAVAAGAGRPAPRAGLGS